MAFSLSKVVPWGRSLAQYRGMFSLTDADLDRRILGCADGPASFNAEMMAMDKRVTSFDPLYQFSISEIRQRIDETADEIIRQTRLHSHTFCWSDEIPTPEALAENRLASMNRFLDDLDLGRSEGRYVVAELPSLPVEDGSYNLAVSSHLLFHYSEHLSEQFHLDSVRELTRVASEVRIFPLLELGGQLSRHLDAAIAMLASLGKSATVETVDYEFRRDADAAGSVIPLQPPSLTISDTSRTWKCPALGQRHVAPTLDVSLDSNCQRSRFACVSE